MMKLQAIVVEDNKSEMENLLFKLDQNCPQIEIIDQCRTGEAAVKSIHQNRPHLIFLDIKLNTMTGFDVLDRLQHIRFEVVFTTGHSEYAIQAINSPHSTPIHYLQKPIEVSELVKAVNKVWKRISELPAPNWLAVPQQQKQLILELNEVVYCESANNHTIFHFSNGKKDLLIKRTLGHYEKELSGGQFFRIHRSYMINGDFLDFYDRANGGFIKLKSGKKLSISPERREQFLAWLSKRLN